MQQYLDLMRHVLEHGTRKDDRTGTGTLSVFGWQMRYNLAEGFPLVTTKKMPPALHHPRAAVVPAGRHQHQISEGKRRLDLGRMGRRERRPRPGLRPPVAPLAEARRRHHRPDQRSGEDDLKTNPDSRRIIVSAWNVADLDKMALAPCHAFFQFYVADGRLSLPALPAQRRHLPRRAVQHRLLRAAHADDGAGHRPEARRLRPHLRRRAPVPEPPRPGARAAHPRAAPAADDDTESGGEGYLRVPLRGFHLERLRPAPAIKAPVAV